MIRLGVLASGRGSNLQAILRAVSRGLLHARIVLVASDKPDAPVLEAAQAAGIATWSRPPKEFPNREAFDQAMLAALHQARADSVALAGYMRLLSEPVIRAFPGRMLNVHPSLLPAFAGVDGAGDTLAYGARFAGCTVHFVDLEVDAGPVIIQAAVPVRNGESRESLMPRIHAMEHRIFPQALQWLAEDRLRLDGRRVLLLPPRTEADDSPDRSPPVPSMDGMCSPPLETGF